MGKNFEFQNIKKILNVSSSGIKGTSDEEGVPGVMGSNTAEGGCAIIGIGGNNTYGQIGGKDTFFKQLAGIYGESAQQGVMGLTTSDTGTGVYGGSRSPSDKGHNIGVRGETWMGVGIQGQNFGPDGLAGKFIGNVEITGDVKLTGADVAEEFSVTNYESAFPGCVMSFNEEGSVELCNRPYDKKAAGVISGAGNYKPGLILDRKEKTKERMPIALMGKVYCMVDADISPIEVGDMLTTSGIPGHAMKATDPLKAFGAVIGKALSSLSKGRELIPILVTIQ